MEISERVHALVDFVTVTRSQHGCKLMPAHTEHLLNELVGIHTSIAIVESSPALNKKVVPLRNHPAYVAKLRKVKPAPILPRDHKRGFFTHLKHILTGV
ncbi:hypothetical protein [Paremcibacter congregatus]|uniref:hypothetical protein n=1 Tax=Paremcibacter congregatus TaxID=2043170 RepID=UPI0030ED94A4|tara:strand:+ start:2444 stop:2740 length:297 start_codon:yes stop_codon:yes gene_type:complete